MVTPDTATACHRRLAEPAVARRTWLTVGERAVSFGDLRSRIERTASVLAQLGLRMGDRVVIATRDDAEAALLFVSLICNGVTVAHLDADTGGERARALIAKAAPTLLVLDRSLREAWLADDGRWRVIDLGAASAKPSALGRLFGPSPSPARSGADDWHGLLDRASPGAVPEAIPEDTIAYILFTSGTTNQPKGVCISHRALFAHLATLSRVYGYGPESRVLNTLMLSHADGMIQGPVIAFRNAMTCHRPRPFEVSAIGSLLDDVYRLRITHMVAVPTMLALIDRLGQDWRDAFQGGDFRFVISCGAALEPSLWESFERRFQVPVVNVYGLTETVVGGVFSGPGQDSRRIGSIGKPVDCRLRVVDDAGRDVPPGQSGELLMHGELLMSGYFDEPEQSAEALRDGWLHTGDIARCDADGIYWILGRKKNIIIRGGLNIHPEEITEVLCRHPGVRGAVAFGIADADWGELVAAVVASDQPLTEAELLSFCSSRLEPRKVPSRIAVVPELPLGRTGKVVIQEARRLIESSASDAPATDGSVEERVLALAARQFKTDVRHLSRDSTPQDVPGWDSLAHLEFVAAAEREFGIALTVREILDVNSLGRLMDILGTR